MPLLSSGDSTYGGASDDPLTETERNNRENRNSNREIDMDIDESSGNEDIVNESELQTDAEDSEDDRQSEEGETGADQENPERPPHRVGLAI
ncbi:Protein of unknown function [Cotesia congregata]|uniref:Uncharacterized protein n=1 Tax=Cotesia congregata TaxID=51543 RepID=A0A8J2H3R5_COTCN|nr:Protein of unknown function [Cotesia congregata]